MFDFIADGIQAYNQAGLFLGALVCFGLGGLILGNSLYWRLHALRATGTVIGVIDKGGMYTPVYRYTLADGQTHEAKSDTSSGWTRGKETGRAVPLMISAHNPTQAREANSYLLDAVGLVIMVPGVAFAYTALTAYPVTWKTWVMAAVMLVFLAAHGRRVLIPKGQRLSIAEWRKQRGLGAAIDPAAIKSIEKILATPEAQQAQQTQRQANRMAAPLLAIFAVILLCVGIFQAREIARLQSSGLRAPGAVVRLKAELGSGSDSRYTYYPIVRYRTDKNVTVEFKDNVGSNPPSYRPGDKVTVLYLADSPRQDVIIDRGPFWNWTIPGLLLFFSAGLGGILMLVLRSRASAKPLGGLATEARV
jgi:Protein of unknown function (DUF3592)